MSRRPKRSQTDMMETDTMETLASALKRMESPSMRDLFTDLVVGDLPLHLPDVDTIMSLLRDVQASDDVRRAALLEYESCAEMKKDFDRVIINCDEGLQKLNRAIEDNKRHRARGSKLLNEMLH